jgi:hypothetical protein
MSSPNCIAPTPDDYVDDSMWYAFFQTQVRYFNNVLIKKMILDLQTELTDRQTETKDAS